MIFKDDLEFSRTLDVLFVRLMRNFKAESNLLRIFVYFFQVKCVSLKGIAAKFKGFHQSLDIDSVNFNANFLPQL